MQAHRPRSSSLPSSSMAISNHRKFLPWPPVSGNQTGSYCFFSCSSKCTFTCLSLPPFPSLPQPPPFPSPPPPSPAIDIQDSKHHISPVVIIMAGVLGSVLFLLTYFFVILKFCSSCNLSRRSPAQPDNTHEDFLDENQGPVLDNPIWYINTVGLDQSIISSIAMFKYRKGDGLVEGTECSVCLSEFREDETLRLLPKCSHAFHLPCIDTWLRSHTNCPLCRARIISNPVGSTSGATVPNSNNPGQEEETRVENSEIDNGRIEGDQSREDEIGDPIVVSLGEEELQDRRGRRIVDTAKEGIPSFPLEKSKFRVLSDLVDNHRGVLESEMQSVRRSVSMDFSSASSIFCFSVANFLSVEAEGSSAAQLEMGTKSNLAIIPKNSGVNPFLLRLKGTSPIGKSLHKSPLSMKRSLSSGGKIPSSSRHSRNRSSLLPL